MCAIQIQCGGFGLEQHCGWELVQNGSGRCVIDCLPDAFARLWLEASAKELAGYYVQRMNRENISLANKISV